MVLVTVQGASSGAQVVVTVDGALSDQLGQLVTTFSNTLQGEIGGVNGINLVPGSTAFSGNSIGYGVATVAGSYSVTGGVDAVVFGGATDAKAVPSVHTQIDLTGVTSSYVSVEGGTTQGVQLQVGSASGTFVAGTGNNAFTGDQMSNASDWYVFTGAGNDTVIAGAGQNTINAGTGDNFINVSNGTNTIYSYGNDTIYGTSCSADQTVSLYGGSSFVTVGQESYIDDLSGGNNAVTVGSGSTVMGGAADKISLNGGTSTVLGGSSDTISASENALVARSDNADVSVSGSLTFIGGTGTSTITAAQSTIYGASGLDAVVNGTGTGETLFVATTGNETLDASGSVMGVHVFGNNVGVSGSQVFIGGTGADTLVAGVGDATMTGGSGAANTFAFRDGLAGGNYVITDFSSSVGNTVGLLNYSSSSLQASLTSQTTANGNTTITLDDKTTITFDNVSSLNSGDFQIW
ncbi:beta strand repeat-containing protein [Acetobacter conturbans]|uniref:Calcium-binding protein n=1 Tax=Acetobacter conturbans TaxID=1737472 RepID=A0ABX0JY28_9PROT|nr:calcium-binding protein [Acetobacter conturbans]NHN87900.1 calcium-binding protein [Acetobacter conturbans]